jgi:signal transduction histidine kinase
MFRPGQHTVFRTVVGYIVAFGLVTLALGEGTYLYARHTLARRLDGNIAERMDSLERAFARGGQAELLRAIDSYTDHGARTFGYVVMAANGAPLKQLDDVPRMPPGWGNVEFHDRDERAVDPARTLTHRLANGSTVTIVADRDFIEQYDAVTTGLLVALGAILFLIAAAGALSLERNVRRRIEALNETARAIFDGDLEQRVPITGRHDEFDAIASTVNAMLDRLACTLTEVRRVSSYIAHDLRAPIVRLRDHLQHGSLLTPGQMDMEAIERCEQIIRLFSTVLRIGEVDTAMVAHNAIEFDLSAMVSELADTHIAVAEDEGRSLSHVVEPGIHATGDRELIAQMLINLIDNAMRHTPVGSRIMVTLASNAGQAQLTVADDGPSLNADDRQRLIDQRRRQANRDRDGLGLKLASVIVAAHQGTILLQDNDPGLRVEVLLPLRLRLARGASAGKAPSDLEGASLQVSGTVSERTPRGAGGYA